LNSSANILRKGSKAIEKNYPKPIPENAFSFEPPKNAPG